MVLEALGQFEDALTDYRAVLAVQPQDPAGWNNLGNASAGLGRWKDAKEFYGKAASLAPEFAFSVANKAVAMFQLGETNESMREMRYMVFTARILYHMAVSSCAVNGGFKLAMHAKRANAGAMVKHKMLPC